MSNLDRLVDKYGDQERVTGRVLQFQENPRLEILLDLYDDWVQGDNISWKDCYDQAQVALQDEYSVEEVHDLSLSISGYQHKYKFFISGLFFSALINSGIEDDYMLNTQKFAARISGLGYQNAKNVTVIGDAGRGFGWEMSSGILTIHGDVGDLTGWDMSDGTMIIYGDAGESLGVNLSGGSIFVEGDTSHYLGESMSSGLVVVKRNAGFLTALRQQGGKIRVGGKIKSIAEDRIGGRLYRGGELIERGEK